MLRNLCQLGRDSHATASEVNVVSQRGVSSERIGVTSGMRPQRRTGSRSTKHAGVAGVCFTGIIRDGRIAP